MAESGPAPLPTRMSGASRDASRLMKAYGAFAASSRSATAASPASADDGSDFATVGGSSGTVAASPAAAPISLAAPRAVDAGSPAQPNSPSALGATDDHLALENTAATTAPSTVTPPAAGATPPRGFAVKNSTGAGAKIADASTSETTTDLRPENFAAANLPVAQMANQGINAPIKKSLGATNEVVAKRITSVGTGVAKSEDLVPSLTANTPSAPTATLDPISSAAPAVSFEALAKETSAPVTTEHVSAAHQAVQTVLEVADRAGSGSQRSVDLQFSVSGVDLSVRVELRGNAVHTTFRTDSPELRTALAHEWQSVATDATTSQSQRLADPVFASNSANSGPATGTNADQRDSGARQQAPTADEFAGARTASRLRAESASATNVSTASVSPTRIAPLAVPGRLNAFA